MNETALSARSLRYFMTMMLSRNFAEAADKLNISQAAISKARKTIEGELGIALFRKSSGKLQPTPEAERLLPFVQRALRHLEATQDMAERLGGARAEGPLVVAVSGPAAVSLIPVAIERLRHELPQVRIDIELDSTRAVIERVSGHLADLALGPPPTQDIDARTLEMCRCRDIISAPLVAVLPKNHRLARQNAVRAQDFSGETYISLPEFSATTEYIDTIFFKEGCVARASITASNSLGVCALVNRGLGIGLVNPLTISGRIFPDIVARPFRPRIALRTCAYTAKTAHLSRSARRLLDHLSAVAKEQRKTLG